MALIAQEPTSTKPRPRGVIVVATLMLFSMFFGAGNLIFPPMLGAHAGAGFLPALVGFLATGVALPVLTMVAVAITGNDVFDLARRVGPGFGLVFTVLVYISIGCAYALPRTAVVSYSAAITPLTGVTGPWWQALFAAIFFGVSLLLVFDPSGVADKLGKYLTPVLLALLALLFVLGMAGLHGAASPAIAPFDSHPLAGGLVEGYMTMDSLGAMAFGIIVLSSLRYKGVAEGTPLIRSASIAAAAAGGLLALIYTALALLGRVMPDGGTFTDGALLLSAAARATLGAPGMMIFGAIVLLACISTAAGLLGAASEFFHRIIPQVSYRAWAMLFALISVAVAAFGLSAVLTLAGPIIGCLYPPAIALVTMTLIERLLPFTLSLALKVPVLVATFWAIATVAAGYLPALALVLSWSPGQATELGWLVPTILAAFIFLPIDARRR